LSQVNAGLNAVEIKQQRGSRIALAPCSNQFPYELYPPTSLLLLLKTSKLQIHHLPKTVKQPEQHPSDGRPFTSTRSQW